MNHQRLAPFALVSATFLAPAAQAVAQNPDAQAQKTVSIQFPGGSLLDFIQCIRKESGANVVVSEIAAEVKLPPLDIRGASVMSALRAVEKIAPGTSKVVTSLVPPEPSSSLVYAVSVDVRPTEAVAVRVFSLRSLTTGRSADGKADAGALETKTVLSAVEAAQRVAGEAATLRYHEESGLLVVRGTAAQINLVKEVLGELQADQQRLRAGKPASGEGPDGQKPTGGR